MLVGVPPAALTEDEPIRFAEDDEPVFDESVNNPALYQEILNPDLTEAQIEDAKSLYNMTRGVMIVTGSLVQGRV